MSSGGMKAGMKIDENCINHNAVRLIEDMLDNVYSLCEETSNSNDRENKQYAIMTLGDVLGVISMANALKEVLKE